VSRFWIEQDVGHPGRCSPDGGGIGDPRPNVFESLNSVATSMGSVTVV